MPQSDFGTIDRNESGSDLATQLEGFRDAVQSGNMGTTAPAYAQAGTPWIDTSATPWTKKVYDGTDWITEYQINPTTNAIIIAIAALILASQVEAEAGTINTALMTPLRVAQAIAALSVPAARSVNAGLGMTGGGNLSADRTISMVAPGTLTGSTTNSTGGVGGSHTHAINLSAADVLPGSSAGVGAISMIYRQSDLAANTTAAGSGFGGYWGLSSGANPQSSVASFAGTWRAMSRFFDPAGGSFFRYGLAQRIA